MRPAPFIFPAVFCALIALSASALRAERSLLEPEQAFRFNATIASDDMVAVSFRIAEGYYLYKDRFSFAVEHDTVKLGPAQFPAGEWHADEFFGRSEIYRREVTIRIPLVSRPGRRGFSLLVVSQGCADIGVCYLPATHRVRLAVSPGEAGLPPQ